MADHIDPSAEAVVLGTFDSVETRGFGRFSMARYVVRDLTRAGLLATPEHGAAIAVQTLRDAADGLSDPDDPCWDDKPLEEIARHLRDVAEFMEREAGG